MWIVWMFPHINGGCRVHNVISMMEYAHSSARVQDLMRSIVEQLLKQRCETTRSDVRQAYKQRNAPKGIERYSIIEYLLHILFNGSPAMCLLVLLGEDL